MDSVQSFAQTILDKNVPISVLINNGIYTWLFIYYPCINQYFYF